MEDYMSQAVDYVQNQGLSLVVRLVAAIAIWVIGRWMIKAVVGLLRRTLNAREVDPTLVRYGSTVLQILLTVLLVIGLLGYFGIDTAGFAALLAGAGVAIGMAWSGLLQDFAAGVFMLVLRPFNVGDEVNLPGGVHGIVKEIGLFTTTVDEWVTHNDIIINNGKAFGEKIENLSRNEVRGAEILVQLSNETDVHDMLERLRKALMEMPGIVEEPAPKVALCDETLAGPVIHVRPVFKQEYFWPSYWGTHQMIYDVMAEAGYDVPSERVRVVSPKHTKPAA